METVAMFGNDPSVRFCSAARDVCIMGFVRGKTPARPERAKHRTRKFSAAAAASGPAAVMERVSGNCRQSVRATVA